MTTSGGLFEGGYRSRFAILGHESALVGDIAVPLPGIPDRRDLIRRVVLRNLDQPLAWRADGITAGSADDFIALPDEIVVLDIEDCDKFSMIRAPLATADVDVRIIYEG